MCLLLYTVYIVTFTYFSHVEASTEGQFYLSLGCDQFGSGMTSNTADSCDIMNNSQRYDIECSCGDRLKKVESCDEKRLNETCERYSIINDPSSVFSFCDKTLSRLGFEIYKEPVAGSRLNQSSNFTTFTNSTLEEKIRTLERYLQGFKSVLDRTMLRVMIESKGARCNCLDNYKKWLCASNLPFYVNKSNGCVDCRSAPCIGNSSICRLKPCISVCHSVLQTCPYYLPSRFQTVPQSLDDINRPNSNESEIISGGYPAFDCPSRSRNYLFNDHCRRSSEVPIFGCDSSAPYQDSSTSAVLISILLFVLIIRSIT